MKAPRSSGYQGWHSPLDEPLSDAEAHALQLGGAAPVLLQDTRRRGRSVSPGHRRTAPGRPQPHSPLRPARRRGTSPPPSRCAAAGTAPRPPSPGPPPLPGGPGHPRELPAEAGRPSSVSRAASSRRRSSGKGALALRLCRVCGLGRCWQRRVLSEGRSRGANVPLLRSCPAHPSAVARRGARVSLPSRQRPCLPRGVPQSDTGCSRGRAWFKASPPPRAPRLRRSAELPCHAAPGGMRGQERPRHAPVRPPPQPATSNSPVYWLAGHRRLW